MVIYRRELCDQKNNPEESRFILDLFHTCYFPTDPRVVFAYFQEFGVNSEKERQELEWAENQLELYFAKIAYLEKKFAEAPSDVDEMILRVPEFHWLEYIKCIRNESKNKREEERKVLYL